MSLLTQLGWGLAVVVILWMGGAGRVLGQTKLPAGYPAFWGVLLAIPLLAIAGRPG